MVRFLSLKPLHPNINKYILHTVLHTFPKVQKRRMVCILKIKNFFWFMVITSFILTRDLDVRFGDDIVRGN